ncbi:hypothetical protein [Streptomyces mangrovisoli]|uniref:Chromosome partitioning protein n=1 Tax=Streptomyces mangrovisoli TaxID=1428628 RepID=A0A1J4NXR5_9ACTN|nr:hypothetical protein [Streptomyces mangrovisoli]OIJ66021.1 hypothetical protein WN71_020340 [Streptomyces mangrovisoli]
MTGIELLAGAAVGYLVRKLRRVAGRADAEVDQVLDTGMDAIHELVTRQLSGDTALETLVAETANGDGEVRERTLRRVSDAVAEHAENDAGFAEQLRRLVDELDRHRAESPKGRGNISQSTVASGSSSVNQAGGNITIYRSES